MRKILIPVDGTKGTKDSFAACGSIVRPAEGNALRNPAPQASSSPRWCTSSAITRVRGVHSAE